MKVWLSCLLLAVALPASGSPPGSTKVASTSTQHADGTQTDTVKDMFRHEMSETTYNARRVVIAKKKFLLGDNGDPTQGTIYDGADNVIARVQFFTDDLGRITEERCTNNQNEIFQRVIHQYDTAGKPLQPQVFNYSVKAPNMRPAKINYTQSPQPQAQKSGPAADQSVSRPGQAPQIESASPGSRNVVTPGRDPAPPNLQIPQMTTPQEEKESKKGSKLNPLNWFKKEKDK